MVAPGALTGKGRSLTVEGEAAHHLGRVLRVRVGTAFELFDGEGRVSLATVTSVEAKAVHFVQDEDARDGVVADRARVTLWQGLAKGDKLETVVRQATELGVAAIAPVWTARSVVQLKGERGEGKRERLQKVAEEAARQSGRADVPTVLGAATLDERLAAIGASAPGELRLVAWEEATKPLTAVLKATSGPVVVLVGPEGGLAADEVQRAVDKGFCAVSLGPRVWRTETVAPALLGMISVLCGDLSSEA